MSRKTMTRTQAENHLLIALSNQQLQEIKDNLAPPTTFKEKKRGITKYTNLKIKFEKSYNLASDYDEQFRMCKNILKCCTIIEWLQSFPFKLSDPDLT